MDKFVGAIDQGTSSTRFIIFNRSGEIVALDQREHAQICLRPGWVEHDGLEIWRNTEAVIARAMKKAGLKPAALSAIGATNQRETTLLWDRSTGEPFHNAICWMDTRTDALVARYAADGGVDCLRATTGLPLSTYFSGLKLAWLFEQFPQARDRAARGELLFGTMESWTIWKLTGGLHITDATNASRTQLMSISTLDWDDAILELFGVPRACLPEIRSNSEVYGLCQGDLEGVPIAGALGDQHAALLGQACVRPGEVKNTYGTGCFLLMNTGSAPYQSKQGLLTTLAFKLGSSPPVYALEGSIAVAGALVRWLRDNLGLIGHSSDIEALARQVSDNGDVYFVPAFAGLFAPRWRPDARGVIAGLTGYSNKSHIARAALEAAAYQTRDAIDAMALDSGVSLAQLRVDGGMAANDLLMQFQADILEVPVLRPKILETTALGAAYAAGLAVGYWSGLEEIEQHWALERRFEPAMQAEERERLLAGWEKAVQRSLGWVAAGRS
jgi:glycerol kinase